MTDNIQNKEITNNTSNKKNTINNVQKAYLLIKEKIQNCEYTPGQFLSEKEIVEDLNLSRTPVREALSKLEGEGKLTKISNKGLMVADVSIHKMKKIYEVRSVLEKMAIKEAIKFIKPDDIEFLTHIYKDMEIGTCHENVKDIFKAGANIHIYIAKLSNNEILYKIIKQLREECYRGNIYYMMQNMNSLTEEERQNKSQAIAQGHIDLIIALMEKNEKKAIEALEKDLAIFIDSITS